MTKQMKNIADQIEQWKQELSGCDDNEQAAAINVQIRKLEEKLSKMKLANAKQTLKGKNER